MKNIQMGNSQIVSSQIALGCMTLGGSWDNKEISQADIITALTAIETALEAGINLFDHADIYTRGKSEKVFSHVWESKLANRESIVLQSKCGIRFANDLFEGSAAHYDFSYEHIFSSVDQILKRLKTDYLDVLLLHRPDALVEPEEVAKAFNELKHQGKVREFGVSNHNAAQISYLQSYLDVPLVANQMEMSLLNSQLIDEGMNVNSLANPSEMRSNGTLEYCRHHKMTLQAWSPLASGQLSATNVVESHLKLAQLITRYATEFGVAEEAIIISWLLRHPAQIQPIIGTRSPERIKACVSATNVQLSKEQWYALYQALPHRQLL